MTEKDIQYRTCPIRNVLGKIGDKWSLLVLYTLNQEPSGVMRYSDLHRQMSDCSQKMLSQTLKNLQQHNLINRVLYPEVPPRVEYSLTPVGKSLMPSLQSIMEWATEHFDDVAVVKP